MQDIFFFPNRWEGGCGDEGIWGGEAFYLIHITVLGLHKHSGNQAAISSSVPTRENSFYSDVFMLLLLLSSSCLSACM